MKFIYYPLVLLWLSIFGQVVLWFGQAKYTLYLSEGTSELKRKFLALLRQGTADRKVNTAINGQVLLTTLQAATTLGAMATKLLVLVT